MNRHATRTEAIDREIIEAIEAGDATAAEYDIEAIADELIVPFTLGYGAREDLSVEEFWEIIENHAH